MRQPASFPIIIATARSIWEVPRASAKVGAVIAPRCYSGMCKEQVFEQVRRVCGRPSTNVLANLQAKCAYEVHSSINGGSEDYESEDFTTIPRTKKTSFLSVWKVHKYVSPTCLLA